MNLASPPIDTRRSAQVLADLNAALARRLPDWPAQPPQRGAAAALMAIVARYGEIIVERLNQAPQARLISLLNLLGASRMPPQAARTLVTFRLSPRAATDVLVPKGTQIAAAATADRPQPVVFETEEDIVVSALKLDHAALKDPASDAWSDFRPLVDASADALGPASLDTGKLPAGHVLYLGDDSFFGPLPVDKLTLHFDLPDNPRRAAQAVVWALLDGAKTVRLTPEADDTASFTRSGKVVFRRLPASNSATIGGSAAYWIFCATVAPFGGDLEIRALTLDREIRMVDQKAAAALLAAGFSMVPLDVTKDFAPFGERPDFNATFYLALDATLAIAGMGVRIAFDLTNPAGGTSPKPAAVAHDAVVLWEVWDGQVWTLAGKANSSGETSAAEFSDSTWAFTRPGQVMIRLAKPLPRLSLNGVNAAWVRARLVGGHYGRDAAYIVKPGSEAKPEYILSPSTLTPPWVRAVSISYVLEESGHVPSRLALEDDFSINVAVVPVAGGPTLQVFRSFRETCPTLYLALLPPLTPPNAKLGDLVPIGARAVRLQVRVAEQPGAAASSRDAQSVSWQYWDGADWQDLEVRDATRRFSTSGAVEFLTPADMRPSRQFGCARYWVRALVTLAPAAGLLALCLNTTPAVQGLTLTNEILGTSDGLPDQTFHSTRAPILAGAALEVRESTAGAPVLWTPWRPVESFAGCAPGDRTYLLDAVAGQVTFGNGQHGFIPPRASAIRFAQYRVGGGELGNLPPGAIAQMKTTYPFVEGVLNRWESAGGADAEQPEDVAARVAASLRHGSRGVAASDFEDLARLASPEVGLVKCIPLRDLATDPAGVRKVPGAVSLILVPRSTAAMPMPSAELLRRVHEYVAARSPVTAQLSVVGPEYLSFVIRIAAAIRNPDRVSEIEAAIRAALRGYFDLMSGGPGGDGWDFGRRPHRSDLYALVNSLPGLDHVSNIQLHTLPARDGMLAAARFLPALDDVRIAWTVL
jgi:hypothetical protein